MQFTHLLSWTPPGASVAVGVGRRALQSDSGLTFQGQLEGKGFSLTPWEVMTAQQQTRLSLRRAGVSRDQGMAKSHMHQNGHHS